MLLTINVKPLAGIFGNKHKKITMEEEVLQMEITKDVTYARDDSKGNRLYVTTYTAGGKPCCAVIKLKLVAEKRTRDIGYITIDDSTLHVRRTKAKHLHNKSNSYGFNYEVLTNDLFTIKNIHIVEDKLNHYLIPAHAVTQFGSYLHFKEQGFELQRFLSMDIINTFRKPVYEGTVII